MAEETNNTEETPEAVSEEPVAEASEATPPQAPAAGEPVEVLAPKERRQRARAARAAKSTPRTALTPEERHAERLEERRRKAQARRVERQRARAKARATATATAATAQETPPREHGPGRQKTRQGVVVSDRADKTITVRIDIARRHRRYEKIVRTSNTLHAHDEQNDAHIGDTVVVRESRPLSRTKRWRLIEVLERAQ
jgi:small subunit ribosomal protein S17